MRALVYGVVITLVLLVLDAPLLYLLLSSFRPDTMITMFPPTWNFHLTFQHYQAVLTSSTFPFWHYFTNSLLTALLTTVVSLVLGFPAAYSMARFNTGGSNFSFWVLSIRMAPPIVFVIPVFVLVRQIGLVDNILALVLMYQTFNLPFTIWFLRSSIRDIPADLDEAMMIDGASRWKILWRMIVPLAGPALGAVAAFDFIFSWNEFLFAFILTFDKATTLTVGAAKFITGYSILWGNIFAVATLAAIPMIVLSIIMQRFMVRGLTLGAVK